MRSGIHGDPTDQLIRGIKHTWSEQINCDCTVVLRPAVARSPIPGISASIYRRYPFTRIVHVIYARLYRLDIPRVEQVPPLFSIFLVRTIVSLFAVINQLSIIDIFLLIINNIYYY